MGEKDFQETDGFHSMKEVPEFSSRILSTLIPVLLQFGLLACSQTASADEELPPGFSSALPTYGASIVVEAPIRQALTALVDVPTLPEWLPFGKSASLMPSSSHKLALLHLYLHGLPGSNDQDVVLALHVAQTKDHKTISIYGEASKDRAPIEPGVLRIQQMNIRWTLTTQDESHTSIGMQVQLLPPFAVPPILLGAISLIPQKALLNFQQRVGDSRYRDKKGLLMQEYRNGFFDGLYWAHVQK